MFNLRASGQFSDEEIVKRVNAMGYHSPIQNHWDKSHQNILGKRGGIPLDVKRMQEKIKRPIYAGIVSEKWTRYLPIKAPYEGLVSIETFNAANRGKVFIREGVGNDLEILYDYQPEKVVIAHKRDNPLYPYKNVILCDLCGNPFHASASKNKRKISLPSVSLHSWA